MTNLKEKKEKLAEQISKLQARYKQLDQKDKVQERKARTKRLLERGSAMENKLSEDAISVFMMMSKSDLYHVEKWLVSHKIPPKQELTTANTDNENNDIHIDKKKNNNM